MKPIRFSSKLVEIKQLSPTVKHLVFSAPSEFKFIPGQYVSLIMDRDEKRIRRPYSIGNQPGGHNIELCIKIVPEGIATPMIDKLKEGDNVEFIGPLGEFILNEKSKDKNIVLISTGTGVAPFRSMVLDLIGKKFRKNLTLIGGYREYVLYNELKELEKTHSYFKYKTVLSPIRVQEVLKDTPIDNTHFYICGLKEMVNSVRTLLTNRGVPMSSIYSEKYD